jgi:hypothetical protein
VPLATIILALLLVSPCLPTPPFADDYMQLARLDPALNVPGFAYAPLDLFTFVSGDPAQRAFFMEKGLYGWWLAPGFRMSFWRPLSCVTHLVDQRLWPGSTVLPHLHSLLWFAALLSVVAALYRRFHVPWIAHLALLLYAVDDARAWVVGWVGGRNALVAATLAFAALLVHDHARRSGWRAGTFLAPAVFATALLGGEAALGVTGYLFAYALFIDQGRLVRRLARLLPYAALSAIWLMAYRALGYGTSGGGMYLNPLDEPLPYLRAVAERLPVLLAAQVGTGLSDVWLFLRPSLKLASYLLALLVLAAVALMLVPLWRRSATCRFWVVGAVLSLAPVCATFPMDRLLVFAGVGAMAAVALVFAEWQERGSLALLPRAPRLAATVVVVLAVFHLVLAPLMLSLGVVTIGQLTRMTEHLDASLPADDTIRRKTLIIVSNPAELTNLSLWTRRQVLGMPAPERMRLLVAGFGKVRVTRLDAITLRVRPEKGFFDNELARVERGASRPFRPGDEVALSDMRARVREMTPDGRPAEVDFTFAAPLEDPRFLWKRIRSGGTFVDWPLPAVGENQLLFSVVPRRAPTGTGESVAR